MFFVFLGKTISLLSSLYILVLLVRVVLDWTRLLLPRWRPPGAILVVANGVYALTDPPLRWLRKFIPPLRLGNVALDVGFIVLFIAVSFLERLGAVVVAMGR